MHEPTHLDLFSGIGGFALAARWAGFRTIAFVEIDKYCSRVLAKNFLAVTSSSRMEGQRIPAKRRELVADVNGSGARIHGNIFDFDGTAYRGCDLLTGGFPCQPFSVAGKRRGAADDRALWPEMFRVINEARPAWVLGENVPGIIPMELDNVLSDLEGIGYATLPPLVIPACAVDAKHRRDRLWIIGRNMGNTGEPRLERHWNAEIAGAMADAEDRGQSMRGRTSWDGRHALRCDLQTKERSGVTWLAEPDVGRVAHGIPSRVDRLKGLGNAIVPQVAYEILREIRRLIQ
jgi:DNA (cytosine-5)-methyltransferase 1